MPGSASSICSAFGATSLSWRDYRLDLKVMDSSAAALPLDGLWRSPFRPLDFCFPLTGSTDLRLLPLSGVVGLGRRDHHSKALAILSLFPSSVFRCYTKQELKFLNVVPTIPFGCDRAVLFRQSSYRLALVFIPELLAVSLLGKEYTGELNV
jgi:hypothetical protein